MTSLEMVQAVEAWVVNALPDLSSYDSPPEELTTALPIVIAEIGEDQNTDAESNLPGQAQFQQTFLRVWNVSILLLVLPDPAWTASHTLYGYVDELGRLIRHGVVLAPNVVMGQYYDANYEPPEVEYSDGTICRQVTIQVTVGETIGV